MRPTYAEIDLGAIRHNVSAFRELIEPSAVCAVVKADGYGHGDVPVANAAVDAGAEWLAVALVEEGARLREAGVEAPIILLSQPSPESIPDIIRWRLTPTAYRDDFVEAMATAGAPFDVHVKIDTGMHRVGVAPEELGRLLAKINASANLNLAGLWTHFSVADEDPEYTKLQIELFDETIEGLDPPMVHLANTAGAALFPESRRDMCRIGLGTYGLHPTPETRQLVSLMPAMKLVSHVSHVQRVAAGERPSYGRMKELTVDSTIATVPVGYADGFARGLSRYGCSLIGGRRFPLAGAVTMDQIMINVGDEDVAVGNEVVLLGGQGSEEITADEWAEELETISYEVVCSIGPRVPRRYLG
ncbi:MAG: alanine racemase [Acidimicrobiia bacterium]|nr:alanine racemase [Acidimicrobiia bacterium]